MNEGYPIQVVSRRTGLTPEVLRIWERRYRVVNPVRSATGRRVYSADEIHKLTLLKRATQSGRRIGDLSGLSVKELESVVQQDLDANAQAPGAPPDASAGAFKKEALEAVREMKSERFRSVLLRAQADLPGDVFVDGFLAPLFAQLGRSWEEGDLEPYQEHLATETVRTVLFQSLDVSENVKPRLLVSTPSGQRHEIGAMLAAVTASVAGWSVVYLGPELPAADIAEAAKISGALVVALSVVYPRRDPDVLAHLREVRKRLPAACALVVGGQSASDYQEELGPDGVHFIQGFQKFRRILAGVSSGAVR